MSSPQDSDWFARFSKDTGEWSEDILSPYQRDRARIIHSSSFRRLQNKTQVVGPKESDLYRTRLTHSVEVMQIASGLVTQLKTIPGAHQAWLPEYFLIEAISLAHDLGHPPFGHGGEVALHFMMRHHGGFEGNAQTLRILTRMGEYSAAHGLDLTRRSLLGVLKYPQTMSHLQMPLDEPQNLNFRTLDLSHWYPPKAIYDEEAEVLHWILKPFSPQDQQHLTLVHEKKGKLRTKHKSFDTSIMELADDIAYGIHDLEDGIGIRMLNPGLWHEKVMENPRMPRVPGLDMHKVTEYLFSDSSRSRKRGISHLVRTLVQSVTIKEIPDFEHPLLRYRAVLPEPQFQMLKLLKEFVMLYMIARAELKTFEYKGQVMIMELFEAISAHPHKLLPARPLRKYQEAQLVSETVQQRVICDYIAGMTDSYATKLYAKIFHPDSGSIFDLL